jgi:hypothetical protein
MSLEQQKKIHHKFTFGCDGSIVMMLPMTSAYEKY